MRKNSEWFAMEPQAEEVGVRVQSIFDFLEVQLTGTWYLLNLTCNILTLVFWNRPKGSKGTAGKRNSTLHLELEGNQRNYSSINPRQINKKKDFGLLGGTNRVGHKTLRWSGQCGGSTSFH